MLFSRAIKSEIKTKLPASWLKLEHNLILLQVAHEENNFQRNIIRELIKSYAAAYLLQFWHFYISLTHVLSFSHQNRPAYAPYYVSEIIAAI